MYDSGPGCELATANYIRFLDISGYVIEHQSEFVEKT
jgi:hypothetical protein